MQALGAVCRAWACGQGGGGATWKRLLYGRGEGRPGGRVCSVGLCGRVWGQVAGAGLGHRLAGSGLQVVSSDGFLLGELNKQFLVLISKSNFLNGFS